MSDLAIIRGDTETLDVAVVDEDTGEAVDISGASLWWYVKRESTDDDDDAVIAKDPSDITIAPGAGGTATVAIDEADTADVVPGVFFWELQIVLGGATRTLAGGRIRIADDLIDVDTP